MATLTLSSTRTPMIVPAARPRLTMPLSDALEMIMLADGRGAALGGGHIAAMRGLADQGSEYQDLPWQITDHKSIPTDAVVGLESHTGCGDVIDQGAQRMSLIAKGAFVTSLGSRPPSRLPV